MNAAGVASRIKWIIGGIASIDPQSIPDDATLREDLDLDSLSLLQISVEVDLEFHLDLPDETYRDVDSLPGMVKLVMHHLADRQAELQAAVGDAPAAGAS